MKLPVPRLIRPGLRSLGRRRLLKLGGSVLAALGTNAWAGEPRRTEQAPPLVNAALADELWVRNYPEQNVWGHADKDSIVPGEPFDISLSTGPRLASIAGHVEMFRVGSPQSERSPVWRSGDLTVRRQPVTPTAAAIGTGWEASVLDVATTGWRPGIYSADFVFRDNRYRDTNLIQIVVRNPSPGRDVLVKLATNTYQAYNDWGGHSLYAGRDRPPGTIVSFDRPGIAAFFEYDVYLAGFLEELSQRASFSVDYVTDFDFHAAPESARRYRVLVSSAHDEYWTKEMFDAVEQRIHRDGRNTIFFGANAAYRQVRYADVNRAPGDRDRGRQLICFKSLPDPIARRTNDAALLVTTEFLAGDRRPETMLMGVGYQSYFPPASSRRYAYRAVEPQGPLFAGTGWTAGDSIGDVVGYEWDNRDPDGDGHRLFDVSRSRIAELPADRLKVLFEGSPIDVDGKAGRAEAVYFESKAGAKVFSAGSTRWSWGLAKPGFAQPAFRRFNENLLLHLLA